MLRWQALPLGDRCAAGTVLHDPRLDPDSSFCDDMSVSSYADLAAAGARPARLGPAVLRTSTAAAVALGALGVLTDRWAIPSP